MGKYNFDFEVSAKGWGKSEIIIYEKGMVYISRATVKRLGLSCPAEVARRYAGRYNIKVEEGVYVLYPAEGARP